MTHRRQISWSLAMRDLRRDRAAPTKMGGLSAAAMQHARALDARRAAHRQPLWADGRFDLSAIMKAAVTEAKVQQTLPGCGRWQQLLRSSLRFAWARAKAERRARYHE
jgi:hypothetical protein